MKIDLTNYGWNEQTKTWRLFDTETNTVRNFTEVEYEEAKMKGKEQAYQMFKEEVAKIATSNKMKFVDAVRAIQLLVNPLAYENDVRRLFEWNEGPQFMERLFTEMN